MGAFNMPDLEDFDTPTNPANLPYENWIRTAYDLESKYKSVLSDIYNHLKMTPQQDSPIQYQKQFVNKYNDFAKIIKKAENFTPQTQAYHMPDLDEPYVKSKNIVDKNIDDDDDYSIDTSNRNASMANLTWRQRVAKKA